MDVQLADAATPDRLTEYGDWWAERKLDGVRCLAIDGRLKTRSGNDVTASFPEIDVPDAHVLDGELVTSNLEFETVLRRVQTEDEFSIEMLSLRYPAWLIVFDVLECNGSDVREKPLSERRELLEPSIPSDSRIRQTTVHDDPMALWDKATSEGWEGIMLKDPSAEYEGERTDRWLKVKDWKEDVFDVVDTEHTDNEGFIVFVDIGTDEPQKVAVNGQDDRRAVENGAEQVEIQYLERSPNDRLRKPSFRGVA